jgi:hypothetical protein
VRNEKWERRNKKRQKLVSLKSFERFQYVVRQFFSANIQQLCCSAKYVLSFLYDGADYYKIVAGWVMFCMEVAWKHI